MRQFKRYQCECHPRNNRALRHPLVFRRFPAVWELVPLGAYVVIALLHEEYKRVSSPCLNARVEKEERKWGSREHISCDYYIRIDNCGPVTLERVSCELPERTWELHTNGMQYPIPALEPGDSTRLMMFVAMGSPAQARATLRGQVGQVDGKSYERPKLLSPFD